MPNKQEIKRYLYSINGNVQGVGFRPFVYRLAHKYKLTGFVSNSNLGVHIEAQGKLENLKNFIHDLHLKLPPMAKIEEFNSTELAIIQEEFFSIQKSDTLEQEHSILIGADMAHCEDCKNEMLSKFDRRYLYPFINCTNCGPRYSITRALPYDRAQTSMALFALCDICNEEYNNPLDRRFHAQPTACHDCGVKIWTKTEDKNFIEGIDALKTTVMRLNSGKIIAIKGIGGFHLACDARNYNSIQTLRDRKNRPHKALAIMVKDVETAREYAYIDKEEEALLNSIKRPILLCRKKQSDLANNINQDTDFIGLMLPSSPLHELLFFDYGFDTLKALVMTSGNSVNRPIALDNNEAQEMLKDIADYFLFHNRDILVRVDDSLIMSKPKEIRHLDENINSFIAIRRARGYVPEALNLTNKIDNNINILSLGADLKASITFIKANKAIVGQHIGNMQIKENQEFMQENIAHLGNLLAIKPDYICVDAHPNAYMRPFADDYKLQNPAINIIEIQHHIAHTYALLADNSLYEPIICLTLDGAGYGLDGTMWGGELFYADPTKAICKHIGSFEKIHQPAYDKAVENTWYMTESYISTCSISDKDFLENLPYLSEINASDRQIIQELCNANVGLTTSSCGRLFDAIGAMLGCSPISTYEGQVPMQLEALQDFDYNNFEIINFSDNDNFSELNTLKLFNNCVKLLINLDKETDINDRKANFAKVARYFHLSLAHSLAYWAINNAKKYAIKKIGLTGGVFLNIALLTSICNIIEKEGYEAIIHQEYSCGDASISLGQAYFALCQLNLKKI